ncbi:hypothetical protein [Sphingomonas sp.]|uniref:hypothetical protein n=1 Tax=Sphingomonas sp. TaxID=28214 RepID=UPI003F7272EB
MEWAQIARVFKAECLCDIYIFDTSLDDWASIWSVLLADSDHLSFTVDGEPATPPLDVAEAFQLGRNHSVCGSYAVGKQRVNCHFFLEEEVEFDLDPRDVDGPAEADRLAEFITILGRATSKEVRLTPENGPDEIIARYEPTTEQFVWMPVRA